MTGEHQAVGSDDTTLHRETGLAADPPAGMGPELDEELLTALALAADPDDIVIDDDAVPFGLGDRGAELLPAWYMPGTLHGSERHRVRRSFVVASIVASMLIVNGVGLCVTYGVPEVGDRLVRFW